MESRVPQHQHEGNTSKTTTVAFSIWPPTLRTRDAVINRLIAALSTPSVLSKHYGVILKDEASTLSRHIEEEAFNTAAGFAVENGDGMDILQVYSKKISKRMLDAVKARPNIAYNSTAKSLVDESISPPYTTDAVSSI